MSKRVAARTKTEGWLALDGWSLAALAIAAIVLAPIAALCVIALGGESAAWAHLWSTTLPRYLTNSALMLLGVATCAGLIGTATAWAVAAHEFPGRRLLQYALMAPMAIPAYIGAYALVELFEYAGPVQTGLRELFGWETSRDYWFPQIRSRGAGIFVMSLSLYPYVYLFAREAFEAQSANMTDVARALGATPRKSFFRVTLPLARPAIVAGIAIVGMEVLNDFGTVEFFAIQTLTTGIFTEWLEAGNAAGAAQIALMMLALVVLLVLAERGARRQRQFHALSKSAKPRTRRQLSGWPARLTALACTLPVVFGFIMPVAALLSVADPNRWVDDGLWRAALNTFTLGASAAIIAVLAALILVQAVRQSRFGLARRLVPLTTIGYAVPGAVLAVGLILPLSRIDHALADATQAITGVDIGLVLTGTAFTVVLAYVVRFFAIAHGAADAGLARVTPSMDMAARSLGKTPAQMVAAVHVPLIRGALGTAALLIFVDAVKELPATLMLRPFNFDTLATRTYGHASLENLERAAPAALMVVAVGLIPVLALALRFHRSDAAQANSHAV